jgi:hypothetical protein
MAITILAFTSVMSSGKRRFVRRSNMPLKLHNSRSGISSTIVRQVVHKSHRKAKQLFDSYFVFAFLASKLVVDTFGSMAPTTFALSINKSWKLLITVVFPAVFTGAYFLCLSEFLSAKDFQNRF